MLVKWPSGCHDPDSCIRHGQCMYIKCIHEGNKILNNWDSPYIHLAVAQPGVGKSAWFKIHAMGRTIQYHIISTDDLIEKYAEASGKTYDEIFSEYIGVATNRFNGMLASYLNSGSNIIVDRTNLTRKSRMKILLGVPNNYIKSAIVFTCSKETQEKRLAGRPGKFIPKHVIDTMRASYEEPTHKEGFDHITFINTETATEHAFEGMNYFGWMGNDESSIHQ
jgi:tRNA uridine 5-carbamoylmethylation protein Kti12